MTDDRPAIFALSASQELGNRIAGALGVTLAALEERDFEDGEHKVRPLGDVRGQDVYAVHSLYGDPRQSVNDKLLRLAFLLGALVDCGAARVTAVLPYLCYARKDARTQPYDPLTTRYVAQILEAVGTHRVVTLEVHNPAAYQNAFRIEAEHVACTLPFVEYLLSELGAAADFTIVSPDPGGFKRADRLRSDLAHRLDREIGIAFMEKARALGKLRTGRLVGEVAGTTAVIVDDIVASGRTLAAAAQACRAAGATRVIAMAAHGLFVPPANSVLTTDALSRIVVSDSVPPFRLGAEIARERLAVVSIAPLMAATIRQLHRAHCTRSLDTNVFAGPR